MITTDLLAPIPILKNLTEQQKEKVAEFSMIEEYEPGDYVVREGQPPIDVYFMLEGKIDLEVESPRGTPIVTDSLTHGDLLNWSACLGGGQVTASSHCRSKVKLIKINGEEFINILQQEPSAGFLIMQDIARTIARRLRESRNRVSHLLADY